MKKILFLLLLLCLTGCAGTTSKKKAFTQEEIISRQKAEIVSLREAVKEKDVKIEELKQKLSAFGAF
jgi:hypothetical protein